MYGRAAESTNKAMRARRSSPVPSLASKLQAIQLDDDSDEYDFNGSDSNENIFSDRNKDREKYRVTWKEGVSIRVKPVENSVLLGVLACGSCVYARTIQNGWVRHARGWSPIWDTHCNVNLMRKVQRLGARPDTPDDEDEDDSDSKEEDSSPDVSSRVDISAVRAYKNKRPDGSFPVSPLEGQQRQEGPPPPYPLFARTLKKEQKGVPNTGVEKPTAPLPDFIPKTPEQEPFFTPMGGSRKDVASRCRKAFMARIRESKKRVRKPQVVYDSVLKPPKVSAKAYLERKPDGSLRPYYTPKDAEDKTLVFESRFECGNLRRAFKVSDSEYDLLCQPDINTNTYAQWFFFCVSNTQVRRYKFNIINMLKSDSLYNYGMMPLVYSTREAEASGMGWTRQGFDVCYFRHSKKYHAASFSIHSRHEGDTLYLAYCYPYTFTMLQKHLDAIETDPKRQVYMRRRVLCQTLALNECEVLTVTDFDCTPEEMSKKPAVVASARVHPGESNASWMMEGLIDFLVGPSKEAAALRKRYLFKIVPMLNPDGVVLGNYRCGLAGVDLNRNWLDPSKDDHPTIFHLKNLVKRLAYQREVVLTTDFHGHSKAMNIFMYGCTNSGPKRLEERIFPKILHDMSPMFDFDGCRFKVKRSKASTNRVVLWRELALPTSFTLEASFAGCNKGPLSGVHFSTNHYRQMGREWCLGVLKYVDKKTHAATRSALLEIYPDGPGDEPECEDSDDSAEEASPQGGRVGGIDLSCALKASILSPRSRLYGRSADLKDANIKRRKKRPQSGRVRGSRSAAEGRLSARIRNLYKPAPEPQLSPTTKRARKALRERERGWGRSTASVPDPPPLRALRARLRKTRRTKAKARGSGKVETRHSRSQPVKSKKKRAKAGRPPRPVPVRRASSYQSPRPPAPKAPRAPMPRRRSLVSRAGDVKGTPRRRQQPVPAPVSSPVQLSSFMFDPRVDGDAAAHSRQAAAAAAAKVGPSLREGRGSGILLGGGNPFARRRNSASSSPVPRPAVPLSPVSRPTVPLSPARAPGGYAAGHPRSPQGVRRRIGGTPPQNTKFATHASRPRRGSGSPSRSDLAAQSGVPRRWRPQAAASQERPQHPGLPSGKVSARGRRPSWRQRPFRSSSDVF